MVFHYDAATRRDVLSRTVIAAQWRYTEWDGGTAGRELYWHPDDPAPSSPPPAPPNKPNRFIP